MTIKNIGKLDNLLEIPEYMIIDAMDKIPSDEREEIDNILNAAKVYKDAEMTPIFLMDVSTYDIYCVARETFGQKLH